MPRVNRVKLLSLALFQGLLFGLLGMLCGVIYSFGGLIYDIATTGGVNAGTGLAFGALIGMPALFAAYGFGAGFVQGILYNAFAARFKGVNLDFE